MVKRVKEVMKKVRKERPHDEGTVRRGSIKAVPAEVSFYAIDGSRLHSLLELADCLEMMSDDTFFYHVTPTKNDFAAWVRDVFKEEDLADRMLRAGSSSRMQVMILRHLLAKFL